MEESNSASSALRVISITAMTAALALLAFWGISQYSGSAQPRSYRNSVAAPNRSYSSTTQGTGSTRSQYQTPQDYETGSQSSGDYARDPELDRIERSANSRDNTRTDSTDPYAYENGRSTVNRDSNPSASDPYGDDPYAYENGRNTAARDPYASDPYGDDAYQADRDSDYRTARQRTLDEQQGIRALW